MDRIDRYLTKHAADYPLATMARAFGLEPEAMSDKLSSLGLTPAPDGKRFKCLNGAALDDYIDAFNESITIGTVRTRLGLHYNKFKAIRLKLGLGPPEGEPNPYAPGTLDTIRNTKDLPSYQAACLIGCTEHQLEKCRSVLTIYDAARNDPTLSMQDLIERSGTSYPTVKEVLNHTGLTARLRGFTEEEKAAFLKAYVKDGPTAVEKLAGPNRANAAVRWIYRYKSEHNGLPVHGTSEEPRRIQAARESAVLKYVGELHMSDKDAAAASGIPAYIIAKVRRSFNMHPKNKNHGISYGSWTEKEDTYILENYRTLGAETCAAVLRRTKQAVTARFKALRFAQQGSPIRHAAPPDPVLETANAILNALPGSPQPSAPDIMKDPRTAPFVQAALATDMKPKMIARALGLTSTQVKALSKKKTKPQTKPGKPMYRVLSCLETKFRSLEEVMRYIDDPTAIRPDVPCSAAPKEDISIPRICVAPSIEACITATGTIGTFRRCLNSNDCTKSYENDSEAYPILVLEFPPDAKYVLPPAALVPDAKTTGEAWLLKPTKPSKVELKWINAYSIELAKDGTSCKSIKFLDDPESRDHPWLNGQGHPLDDSGMGDDPWPEETIPIGELALCLPGRLVVRAVRSTRYPGFMKCYPIGVPDMKVFHASRQRLRFFTGFFDAEGVPLLDRDHVLFDGKPAIIADPDGAGWAILPLADDRIISFRDASMTGKTLASVRKEDI